MRVELALIALLTGGIDIIEIDDSDRDFSRLRGEGRGRGAQNGQAENENGKMQDHAIHEDLLQPRRGRLERKSGCQAPLLADRDQRPRTPGQISRFLAQRFPSPPFWPLMAAS